MKSPNIFRKGLLFAAVFSVAAAGVIGASAMLGPSSFASAQEMTMETNDTTTTNATEITSTTSSNKLAGIIASLQVEGVLTPEWVTAGYWELESDGPVFGASGQSGPTVTEFNAIVEMTRFSNGTFLHGHTFSNFRQSDTLFSSGNSTIINGTMTVTTEHGPTEDVPVYITLKNNLVEIYVNPEAVDNHFGRTPIYGMILSADKLQQISDLLSNTGGTGTAEMLNGTSVAGSTGNATGQ